MYGSMIAAFIVEREQLHDSHDVPHLFFIAGGLFCILWIMFMWRMFED